MSCNKVAIEVQNITKSYQLYAKPIDRLRQMFTPKKRTYFKEFTALNDISFKLQKGDCVGVLGHNGAGKSTLLQLITGILTPTSGQIIKKGRVAALLELGAGFNPEFTGKENVYMNASILGLSKREIDEKYEDILKFADIGDFISRPVKTYSSGMYVRLAFSVAVHTDPEILIVDEALAVGDIRFQMKCIKHMEMLKENGTTILFVTHAPEQVQRFCNKALWLDKGIIKTFGSSSLVCDQYRSYMSQGDTPEMPDSKATSTATRIHTYAPAKIISTKLNKQCFSPLELLSLEIEYEVFDEEVTDFLVGAAIYSSKREFIFGPNTYLENVDIPSSKGKHKIKYSVPKLTLLPGEFSMDVGIFCDKGLVTIDYRSMAENFNVESDYFSEGIFYIEHDWEVLS
ncbi:ABC transporter ATP-binding protein [Vibrio rumoiensis]|uniref:ABC transporter ATP-binding protein n=1 Tax=Vibrio rumoiensis TaxID=76258 RepID=A0ABW7IRK3_9VIBR